MSYMIAPEFRRNSRPASERGAEAKMKCSLFDRCKGCPYPRHGFVCWNQDGHCMREIMKKLNKGVETNDDKCGTE